MICAGAAIQMRISFIKLLRRTLVANGTKRHFAATQHLVAFGGKADIADIAGHSPDETLWNVALDHSGLMLANLITLAHFSVSSVITFAYSTGDSASTVPP
jgi:hypothetical protein